MSGRVDAEGPVTLFARHVIVPAAIIAMVAAFLFYLLEVRSVLGLGDPYRETAFKQVGLCFAAATVLIARYGRVHSSFNDQNHGCYTAALAIATLLFMIQSSGGAGFLVSVLIITAVWRFATGVTRALSLEGEIDPFLPPQRRLYGLERLRFEAFRKQQQDEKGAAWGTLGEVSRRRPDGHGNPVAAVARLAALALLGFAVGEPFLLRAAPEVAERALADVIVFLFSTGIVLAAGSAAGTLRHTLRAGGRVSPSVLPARIALAAFLAVLVLAAALAVPGVHFRGTGGLQWTDRPGETGTSDSRTDGRQSSDGKSDAQEEPGGDRGRAPQPKPSGRGRPSPAPSVVPLVNVLSALGKLLLIPLVLAILVLAFLAIRYFRPALPSVRDLLARLRAWLRARFPERKPPPAPAVDPFADLWTLNSLPPRDAVLAAYGRLLLALEQAGHPRAERTAPYEHLSALPKRLGTVEAPAREITDLYALVAYGDGPVDDGQRTLVIAALGKMSRALRETAA
jgi:hypothetical protein